MATTVPPTPSFKPIVPSEVVAKESASCPHAACAPTAVGAVSAASIEGASRSTFTSDTAMTASSQDMHCLVAAVSSDDATTTNGDCASTDDLAVQEDIDPPVVHRPSSLNKDGVSAPGTSQDMPTNSSAGMSTATSSDELVTAKTVHPDTFVTAPVSTCVARAAYHPASGVFHTTAKETANSSPAMSVNLSTTTEVGGIMANHIQGVSTATVSGAVNTDQVTKKRKSKDQRTRKWAKVPKDKDPDAPKKNLTAYMHYATYARAYLKPRNPQLKGGELTKNVVQRGWNRLSSQERHYWDEKAAADKMRYERDLAKYKKSELGVAWQARVVEKSKQATSGYIFDTNAGKKAKDSFAPEQNSSAYKHYDAYARAYIKPRHPQMENDEVSNVVHRGWSDMSAEERYYWDWVAAADKVMYLRELSLLHGFEVTAQDIVEAKVSTQEALDDLCVG